MPINEPIRNRKVAPASLAFESARKGQAAIAYEVGTTPTIINYQTNLTVNSTAYFISEFNDALIEDAKADVMRGVANAELRAKSSVGDYHRAFLWTSDNSQFQYLKANNAFGAITPLQAPNEVIATDGCATVASPVNPNTAFRFRCPDGGEGVYWMYAHVELRVLHEDDINIARLAIQKNGGLWQVVDVMNADSSKHNDLGLIALRGGVHIPLQPGDFITWIVAFASGAAGGGIAADRTSYFASINGHRESCEYREVNAPYTGADFNASLHV